MMPHNSLLRLEKPDHLSDREKERQRNMAAKPRLQIKPLLKQEQIPLTAVSAGGSELGASPLLAELFSARNKVL